MQKGFSVEIDSDKEVNGEGHVHRSILSPGELVTTPSPEIETLYDLLQYSAKTHGEKPAFGYRKVINIIEEEKEVTKVVNNVETKETKKWQYFQLSSYSYHTYPEVVDITKTIGSGLIKIGAQRDSKIVIFASTSMHWMLMAHGCFTQGLTIVTAYDTLGESGLRHSMNETEAYAVFTNADLLVFIKNIAGDCPKLQQIIYDGEPKGNILDELKAVRPDIKLHTFEELQTMGKDNLIEPNPPKSSDTSCIMYTSGSTGNPKGVLLSHANLVATVGGIHKMIQHIIKPDDNLLAYLPLAHVLEFVVEQCCIFWGVTLGYGTIRTLTDASVRNCLGDIREFKPSLMTGVPAVWETIRKGILAKVHATSGTAQKVFNAAFRAKAWCQGKSLPTKPFDIVVFNKIKQQTGGRLRYALSGGAPISKETQEFLSVTLCPILQGYGMTESCGMCAVLSPEQFRYECAGSPVPCVEVKLVDVGEAGYLSTNTPRSQGEVYIRGPCVASGYYKNEVVTKETFTDDGWLQTGDIGEWHPDGVLSIVDRKKNLVKLSHGEYIALEKLESVYKSCLYVSEIMVYADSLQSRPIALVYPLEARLRDLAAEKNVDESDFQKLCENKEVVAAVYQSLVAQAKKAGFKPAEIILSVELFHEEWSAQSGHLTAARKIRRRDVVERYKENINRMYGIKK